MLCYSYVLSQPTLKGLPQGMTRQAWCEPYGVFCQRSRGGERRCKAGAGRGFLGGVPVPGEGVEQGGTSGGCGARPEGPTQNPDLTSQKNCFIISFLCSNAVTALQRHVKRCDGWGRTLVL